MDIEAIKKRLARIRAQGPNLDRASAPEDEEEGDEMDAEFGTAVEPVNITAINLRRKSRSSN